MRSHLPSVLDAQSARGQGSLLGLTSNATPAKGPGKIPVTSIGGQSKMRAKGTLVLFALICFCLQLRGDDRDKLPAVNAFFDSQDRENVTLSNGGAFVARLSYAITGYSLSIANTKQLNEWQEVVTDSARRSITHYFWTPDEELVVVRQSATGADVIQFDCAHNSVARNPESSTKNFIDALPAGSVVQGLLFKPGEGASLFYLCPGSTPGYPNIGSFSLVTGKCTRLYTNAKKINDVHGISGNGASIIGSHARSDGSVDLLKLSGTQCTLLARARPEETMLLLGFDNTGAALVASNVGKHVDKSRLLRISLNDGSVSILDEDPLSKADLHKVLLSPLGELLGTTYITDRLRFYPKTKDAMDVYSSVSKDLREADIDIVSTDRSRNFWLIHEIYGAKPGAYHLWDQKLHKLTSLTSQGQYPTMAETMPLRYLSRDGIEITGYITVPKVRMSKKLPTIVFPHGGPRARTSWNLDSRVQFLASRGYAVFQPNYRGSKGFGKRFIAIANKQYGGTMQDDITDGVHYLIQQGIADPKRIGIFGGSFGGYCALSGLAFTPQLYAAGVSFFGISDLNQYVRETRGKYLPFIGQLKASIGDPENLSEAKLLGQRSPVNATNNICAPLLLYHGKHDEVVFKTHSDVIFQKLTKRHHLIEYFVSQEEGHGFSDPLNEQALFVAIERFFGRYLGGSCSVDVDADLQLRLRSMKVD